MADEANLEAELRQLLAVGRPIEAIKRYRQATGVGLAEAKAAVESLIEGDSLRPEVPIEADLERAVVAQLEVGRKIAAIRFYREATGARLKEAKEAVEAIAERHGISRMAKSGCLTLVLLMLLPLAILSGLS
jgi:ribosomal protein L7/L12